MPRRLAVLLLLVPALIPGVAQGKTHKKKHAKVYNLKLTLQKGRTHTALIGDDGGSVTTTGADGTVFTLTVPPASLLSPATVSITPIKKLKGLPHRGKLVDGVKLSPSGLTFTGTGATLRIHRKHQPTLKQLKAWGAVGTAGTGKGARSLGVLPNPAQAGDDPAASSPRDEVLPIRHFSTGSIETRIDTMGGPANSIDEKVDQIYAPGMKKLAAEHAYAVAHPDAPGNGVEGLSKILGSEADEIAVKIIDPRAAALDNASEPAIHEVTTLQRLVFSVERQFQLFGATPSQKTADALARAQAAVNRARDRILKKLVRDCRDRGFAPGFIRPTLALLREVQLVGGNDDAGLAGLEACLAQQWKVKLSGTAGVAAKRAGNPLQLSQGQDEVISSSTLGVSSSFSTTGFDHDRFGYAGSGALKAISTKVTPATADNICAASFRDFEPSSKVGVIIRPDLNTVAGAARRVYVIAQWDDYSRLSATPCGGGAQDTFSGGLVRAAAPRVFSVPINGSGHAKAAKPDDLSQYVQTASSFKASATKGG